MYDEAASAIRVCDAGSGLTVYVSKMVPPSDKGRLYGLGRVSSGTTTGQKVRTLGPHYKPSGKEDLNVRNTQKTVHK